MVFVPARYGVVGSGSARWGEVIETLASARVRQGWSPVSDEIDRLWFG